MGDPKGFLKVKRQPMQYRPVCERVKDYNEVVIIPSKEHSKEQACRCMDCGTPFCHWACPIGNYIPEWNDFMFNDHPGQAHELLSETNNMPEVTGRICPALCEYACVLGINDDPVTIRENELAIAENAFSQGLVKAKAPKKRTGKKIAVIGSGPAGLSCADQLNKAGHTVVIFEKDDKIGGILRYGIPDFKLEKHIIDRRIKIWKKEGVIFKTGINAGLDYKTSKLASEFGAIVLAGGSRVPRDLNIAGRDLKGIYFAMDYLIQANKTAAGEKIPVSKRIYAKDKRVVIIGGGDTGADCVGTAHRQGAKCVIQIELLSMPPECRTKDSPWPQYPLLLKNSSSHLEGGERYWSVLTKKFTGKGGYVKKLHCTKIEFPQIDKKGCPVIKETPGSEFEIETDLVIIAVGFIHTEHSGIVTDLKLGLDNKGNVKTNHAYASSAKGVFCAGDARRGQSLVVWAISDGRRCAYAVDEYLMGNSSLPFM